MKTIIISDLHHRIDWIEPYLATQKFDQVVFLGDYFDDYGDNPKITEKTALWLKKQLYRENFIFLMGNHDLAYRFPKNWFCSCPGFTEEKSEMISSILNDSDWQQIYYFYFDQGWVFSHAGFDPRNAKLETLSVQEFLTQHEMANFAGTIGVNHPYFRASATRGGRYPTGGILWQDWRELLPYPGLHQIVGHTQGKAPRKRHQTPNGSVIESILDSGDQIKWSDDFLYQAVCLDTDNHHVGVLENQTLTIERIK